VPYLKVVHVRSGMAAQDVLRSAERYRGAAAIVLDSGDRRQATGDRVAVPPIAYRLSPIAYGGTGLALEPAMAAEVVRRFRGLVMLAGGLRPEMVARTIRAVQPWGVDVSSGVETDGAKDEAKITAFVAAAKGAL
jgi:phosphoribosylanthranilate isomerase